jgi:phosphatidylglycerol:prolipoprotein diacylglycerol transferase
MPTRYYYTLFMLLALAVFLAVRQHMPKSRQLAALSLRHRLLLAWAILVGGALGAKAGYLAGSGGSFFDWPTWLIDGKTVTTGLIGAYLAVELTKFLLGIRVKTGDSYALPLALALAVGRWGCYFHGCCFGNPTDLPWGITFHDGIPRHPTQLYEVAFHLIMAGVLGLFMYFGLLRFQLLKFYLIAYGVYRFLTEFIRPEPAWALGLTFYQWVCLVMVLGLAVQWRLDRELAADPEPTESPAAEPVAIP